MRESLPSVLVPLCDVLRSQRRSMLVIMAVLALTGSAIYPLASLASNRAPLTETRAALPPIPGADLEAPGSLTTRVPHQTQQLASDAFYRFALGSGVALAVLGLLSALTLGGARTADRMPEFAIRRAVGGSRRQLFATIALEGTVLALTTAALAAPVAALGVQLIHSSWPGYWQLASAPLLLATVATILGGAVASLLLPYLIAPRPRLSGEVARPLSLLLPVAQIGCSLILLTGGALAIRYARVQTDMTIAAGPRGRVLSLEVRGGPELRASQYRQLLARLPDSAGAGSVSLGSHGLRLGLGTVEMVLTDCGDCAEGAIRTRLKPLLVTEYLASPDTFRALGLPLVTGRPFAVTDDRAAPLVAVVTRSLATRGFQFGEAVGRDLRIRTGGAGGNPDGEWFRVVGIVEDYLGAGYGSGQQPRMAVFLSVLQRPPVQAELLVRGPHAGKPEMAAAGLTGGIMVRANQDETDLVLASLGPTRWFGQIFTALGWVLLLIGVAGSLVIMRAWLVSLLPELGLRAAVGATRGRLLAMVLGRLAAALGTAFFFAVWVAPGLRLSLSRVAGADVGPTNGLLLGYTALLAAGALLGLLGPMRRAAHSPPAQLLEHSAE